MKLFYRPNTGRPLRVAWVLEELGLKYEAVAVSSEETSSPEFLARSPLGAVPALERDDGVTVFDSTAIVFDLADAHPDGGLIAALGSPARAQTYQWSLTAMTALEPATIAYLSAEAGSEAATTAHTQFEQGAGAYVKVLGNRKFLIGDTLSVADVVTGGVLAIAAATGLLPAAAPGLVDYFESLKARPGYQRGLEVTESLLRPAAA